MAYHVAYLAKAYNIPPSLIIINDQTRIHLVPTVGECTWESRGSKHIHIFGIENKWQVIMVVSSFLAKIYLPITNHLHRHYRKDIATKQPKKSNVCSSLPPSSD
jgi:hypothetical protein